MPDLFRKTLKDRMKQADEVSSTPPQQDLPVQQKAPVMSQADFLYGKSGSEDPRKKNASQRDKLLSKR
jgi:hypothetical protein